MRSAVFLPLACAFAFGCGPPAPRVVSPPGRLDGVVQEPRRPPLATLARDGDPVGAIGAVLSLAGFPREPEMAVALAALFEGRLKSSAGLEVRPGWSTVEIRVPVGAAADAAGGLILALDAALRAPVTAQELDLAQRRLVTLSKKPLPDGALRDVARCRGEAFAVSARPSELTLEELDQARQRAVTLGRVAFSAVGPQAVVQSAGNAMARLSPFSDAAAPVPAPTAAPATVSFVEQPGMGPQKALRGHVVVRTTEPARAVLAARALALSASPLLTRMRGLEGAPKVQEIAATANLDGGCLGVTLDFGAQELGPASVTSRVATALALTTQEAQLELDAEAPPDFGWSLARQATDPRDAAGRAALWVLLATTAAPPSSAPSPPSAHPIVVYGAALETPTKDTVKKGLEQAVERAVRALSSPVVTSEVRVERGQAEMWILLASPCGTTAEVANDAGLASAFAQASLPPRSLVQLEPYVAADAVGLIAHGPALPGEPPQKHARRIADAAARAFVADPLDETRIAAVRSTFRARANDARWRALYTLGDALSKAHPSWLVPEGNPDLLARVSVASLAARAAALREGPLRATVLANGDDAQAEAAARALDRWVVRRPDGLRACPLPNEVAAPRPGTYAVDVTGAHEVYVAFPLAPAQRELADGLADAMSGDGGPLAKALLQGGLARTATVRVLGGKAAAALVFHVASTDAALDAAVAQLRGVLDRLRRGGFTDADVDRATTQRAAALAARSIDPRARLVSLFRGASAPAPLLTLDALNGAARSALAEDGAVIVVMRPPRGAKP